MERSIGGLSRQEGIFGGSTDKLQVWVRKLGRGPIDLPASSSGGWGKEGRAARESAWWARPTQSPRLVAPDGKIHHQSPRAVLFEGLAPVMGDEGSRAVDPPVLAVGGEIDERIRSATVRIGDMEGDPNRIPGPARVAGSHDGQ